MINKKQVFVLLLLFIIISISAVNAEEPTTNEELSISNIDMDIPLTDGENENQTDEQTIFEGNFNELNTLIENASDGSVIELNEDYNGSGEINITKNLTINGNNHIIDANSKSGIFYIHANSSVILNNIQFCNGNTADRIESGGAIYSEALDLKINNCTFIDCQATYGGAISSFSTLEINDCEFINNTAEYAGGAIASGEGETIIKNTTFRDNIAYYYGGAIYLERNLNLSTFTVDANNAINSSIENSIFENNAATYGGAIYSENHLTLTDSEFNNNSAETGGAIYTYNGAVYQNSTTDNETNTTNTTSYYQRFDLEISGTVFRQNTAEDGGAITVGCYEEYLFNDPSIFGKLIINNGSVFDNNTATYGGAILLNSAEANITDTLFTSNSATFGGAIYSESISEVTIEKSTFIDNIGTVEGGSILSECILNVTDSIFTNLKDNMEFISHTNYITNDLNGSLIEFGSLYLDNNTMTGDNDYDIYYAGTEPLTFKTKLTFENATVQFGDSINLGELQDMNDNTIAISKIIVTLTNINNANVTTLNLTYDFRTKGYLLNTSLLENATYNVTANMSSIASDCEITPALLKVSDIVLNASDIVKFYGGSENYTVTVRDANSTLANVSVTIRINDENFTVKTDDEGQASIPLDLEIGSYEITSEYDSIKITTNITVLSTVTAEDGSGQYLNTVYTAKFLDTSGNASSGIEVKFVINDIEFNATTENGEASANIDLDVGNYTMKVINLANNEEKEINLTITKSNCEMDLTAAQDAEIVKLSADLNPKTATGEVIFTINNVNYTATIENGTANVNVENLNVGTYPVTATYLGDNNLNNVSAGITLIVEKIVTKLTILNTTKIFGEEINPKVLLSDVNDKAIANASLEIILNGDTLQLKTDENGFVEIDYNLDCGNHPVLINYNGNDKYKETSTYGTLTINKVASKILVDNLTKTYGDDKALSILLIDANGNPIANTDFIALINNNTYPLKTNNIGEAKLLITSSPSTYEVFINFDGGRNYNGMNATTSIVVEKATLKLKAPNKTFKAKTKTKKYKISLKTANKSPVKKAKVTLKINGKTYKAKTNKKGKATFKITKLTKKAKYIAVVKFKGSKNYNKVEKKVQIKVK